MKSKIISQFTLLLIGFLFIGSNFAAQVENITLTETFNSEDVETFKAILKNLSKDIDNELFAIHFQSIVDVIEAKGDLNSTDLAYLSATFPVFSDSIANGSPTNITSYLNRSRQLTIAWVSPTDGKVSFSLLRLPRDWDPCKSYPLYIDLHKFWCVTDNPIGFMTTAYRNDPLTSQQFEDGYYVSPWGRGNLWYEGISETDIWEGIWKIESLVKVDQSRKYLTGYSMGGFGAWKIASKSPGVCAAIAIHAGDLWYGSDMLSDLRIQNLSKVPVYFLVGENDGLYKKNMDAYNLLMKAGNQNVKFETFQGIHEYKPDNMEKIYQWFKNFKNEKYSDNLEFEIKDDFTIQIFPNPVREEASFHLNLTEKGLVILNLINKKGQKIATILNNVLGLGETVIIWKRGEFPSGIYTYSLFQSGKINCGKLMLY